MSAAIKGLPELKVQDTTRLFFASHTSNLFPCSLTNGEARISFFKIVFTEHQLNTSGPIFCFLTPIPSRELNHLKRQFDAERRIEPLTPA